MEEDAREALLSGALSLARGLAVEKRLPEPVGLDDTLRPPATLLWGEALPVVRELAGGAEVAAGRALDAFQPLLD